MIADAQRQLPPSDRTDAPEAPAQSNAIAAMNPKQFRIPGDVVNKATENLPDDQRSAIRRLHAVYTDNVWSLGELEAETGIDRTMLTQVFRGVYGAKLDGVVERIERYFDLEDKRATSRKLPFVVTKLTTRIWEVCETALEMKRIAFIFGESQIGKTAALRAYQQAHNHGATIYTDVPTGGSLLNFLAKLASALRISPHQRRMDLRRRIIDSFDSRMLLIVDEASRCLPQDGRSHRGIQIIEFIRELFDEADCGVVICATNVFRKEMREGQMAKLLDQTKRRRCAAVQLPDVPTAGDLNVFANHYGLVSAAGEHYELQNRIVIEEGLGMWLTILRMAAKVANKKAGARMSWDHVQTAYAGLLKLEGR